MIAVFKLRREGRTYLDAQRELLEELRAVRETEGLPTDGEEFELAAADALTVVLDHQIVLLYTITQQWQVSVQFMHGL